MDSVYCKKLCDYEAVFICSYKDEYLDYSQDYTSLGKKALVGSPLDSTASPASSVT